MFVFGAGPLAALLGFNWVRIGGNDEVAGLAIGVRMFDFLLAPLSHREWFAATIDTTLATTTSRYTAEMSAAFGEWFAVFGLIYTAAALLMVGSFVCALASVFAGGAGKARCTLSYIGYGVYVLSCLGFIIAGDLINRQIDIDVLVVTEFAFAAMLAGLLALIYAVRFPVLSKHTRKRNPFATRVITSFVPVKGDGVREGIRKVIFTAALVCFVFFGTRLGVQHFELWRAQRANDELRQMAHQTVNLTPREREQFRDAVPRFHLALWRENNDTVGFIELPGTVLAYPVLQADTNRHYLRRDFHGNSSMGGSIFADFRNVFDGYTISRNTVVYGHSGARRDAYFTLIPRYFTTTRNNTLSFYRENPIITFNTLFEEMEWKVFAVGLYNTEHELGTVVPYWRQHEFADEDEFHDFIIDIMDRSVLHTATDIQYGDHLLTLSTCHFHFGRDNASTRAVVFARRLRPGETADSFDVNAATRNRRVYYGDFRIAANAFGRGERGVWDRHRFLLSYRGD
jgi:sortase B